MLTDYGERHSCRSMLVVGLIAAAMILTAPISSSHAASSVFATVKESGSITSGSPIVKLTVPAGKYAIFAKINLDQDDDDQIARLVCRLRTTVKLDRNVVPLQDSSIKRLDNAAVSFQIVQEFGQDSFRDITLSCGIQSGGSNQLSFRYAKIMAIRLDGILCEKPSLAVCP